MYKRILVPVDGSETALRGLHEAVELARTHQSTIELLHVINDYPLLVDMTSIFGFEEMRRVLRRHGEDVLAAAKEIVALDGIEVRTVLREVAAGRAADVIIREAADSGCDVIVMGTHGRRGFSRQVLGSDAESVARSSPVPVILVRLAQPAAPIPAH